MKDSARNAQATDEFICNLAITAPAEKKDASSAAVPPEADEFELAGLAGTPAGWRARCAGRARMLGDPRP